MPATTSATGRTAAGDARPRVPRSPSAAGAGAGSPGAGGSGGDADAVLAGLDPEQREVATALTGPVCVLAGAGTGKTRAITHRIAYGVLAGVYVPQRVLAVTFTARAAGELRGRLRGLGVGGVQARTFHAAALRQLGYFWPQVIGGAPPQIVEHKAGLIADAAARLRLTVDRAAVRDLAAEVEWAKVGMLTAQSYPGAAVTGGRGQPGGFDIPTVARLLEVYEEVKAERGVIDFEDVLLLTVGILAEHPEVAAAVRAQYRHLVVDEYQDVSALQQRLLDEWLGDQDDVCVVGDPSQTIYSFAGASPRYLLDFPSRHPGAQVVHLVRDYRSTPQVVGLANGLLARAGRSLSRPLRLVAQRPPGPEPTLTGYQDDEDEATGVTARIGELITAGTRASEIAVLFRTNAQSQALESALAAAGIGYLLRGGERFFARREIREAMLLLRGAARGPSAGEPLGEQVRAVLSASGWTPQPPSSGGAVRERWESLQALAVLADEMAGPRPDATRADLADEPDGPRPNATLADLVAELDERAAAQHAPTVEGVTLASLHAAKGLEWDAVFVIGLSEGLMPISLADGWAEVEEERRLLYVGITRARVHLYLSYALARSPGGRANRSPSRFLDGLPAVPAGLAGGGRRGSSGSGEGGARGPRRGERSGRGRLATTCRICTGPLTTAAERKIGRCASCPADYDEALFLRLREWRSATAAAAGVPAYVVFTDATLVAIAETLPRDLAGLARIAGVGPAKLDRYGEQVLALLGDAG